MLNNDKCCDSDVQGLIQGF